MTIPVFKCVHYIANNLAPVFAAITYNITFSTLLWIQFGGIIPTKTRTKFYATAWRHATALLTISYLMIFSYSLSLPLESRQRLYMTDASTLAGLYVLGSFNNEITESRIVLTQKSINYPKSLEDYSSYKDNFYFLFVLPDILRRIPPLARQLAALWIIYGWMQDWYAQITVLYRERKTLRPVSIFSTFLLPTFLHFCD